MNTAQLNIDPETGEVRDTEAITTNNRPTKREPKYNMLPTGQQPSIPKPHAHIMMK